MSWNRTIDLYYDVEASPASPLLKVEANSISVGAAPVLIAGDHVNLRVFLRTKTSSSTLEPVALPTGFAMIFAGKKMANGPTGNLLFYASSFVAAGEGDDAHYLAPLDLNTADLMTALGESEKLTVRCDLQIQNSDNSRRYTMQADFTVRNQAYAGEGAPGPSEPSYPLPEQIVLREPEAGNYRFLDGTTLQFRNLVTDTFETIEARIQSGISLTIEGDQVAIYLNGVRRGLL